jgi:hypothetical protein
MHVRALRSISCAVVAGAYSRSNARSLFFYSHTLRFFLDAVFPYAIRVVSELVITCRRLEDFLVLPDMEPPSTQGCSPKTIELDGVTASWTESKVALVDVTFAPAPGSLTCETHQYFFSCLSTLNHIHFCVRLDASLVPSVRENQPCCRLFWASWSRQRERLVDSSNHAATGMLSFLGTVQIRVAGRCAYAAQQPWILSDTIRSNMCGAINPNLQPSLNVHVILFLFQLIWTAV